MSPLAQFVPPHVNWSEPTCAVPPVVVTVVSSLQLASVNAFAVSKSAAVLVSATVGA